MDVYKILYQLLKEYTLSSSAIEYLHDIEYLQ